MEEVGEIALSQMLVKKGLVSMENLQRCLQIQKDRSRQGDPKNLEKVLIEQNLVDPEDIRKTKNTLVLGKEIDIPGYLFLEKIGEGGMGTVYKGKQLSLDRHVAVKLLDIQGARNKNFVHRFIQEARVLAQLSHKNIVKAIDFGESGSVYYYVMEYLRGRNLQEIVESKGPLSEKTALSILSQMAQALGYIQEKQLVHRDIKPENILLCRDGTAKLCDLGLVKWHKFDLSLTTEGSVIGTPYYLSPEQAQGLSDIDIRSDIYSLGATLYFMLTGKPPYEGEKATVIHFRHIYDPPPKVTPLRPELTDRWNDFFARIMAKNIAERIQSPQELNRAIVDCLMEPLASSESSAFEIMSATQVKKRSKAKTQPVAQEASLPKARGKTQPMPQPQESKHPNVRTKTQPMPQEPKARTKTQPMPQPQDSSLSNSRQKGQPVPTIRKTAPPRIETMQRHFPEPERVTLPKPLLVALGVILCIIALAAGVAVRLFW